MVKKAAMRVPKEKKEKKGKREKGETSKPIGPLLPAPVNWTKSTVSEATLKKFANTGELPKQADIFWRAASDETWPRPQEGEVVVLLDHVTRGLRPPGSNFYRRVLSY